MSSAEFIVKWEMSEDATLRERGMSWTEFIVKWEMSEDAILRERGMSWTEFIVKWEMSEDAKRPLLWRLHVTAALQLCACYTHAVWLRIQSTQ
jgi:hypothetical protein